MPAIFSGNITDHHVVFRTYEEAENALVALVESADDGETFEIVRDPSGSRKCLIEKFYRGKSEGYF